MAASAEESAVGEEASEEEADEPVWVLVSPSVSEALSFFPLALVPLAGVVSAGASVEGTAGVERAGAAGEGDGCGAFGAGSLAASVKREEKLLPPWPDVEEEEKGSEEDALPEAGETEAEPFGEREMGMRYSGWIMGCWNPIHRKYCPPSS